MQCRGVGRWCEAVSAVQSVGHCRGDREVWKCGDLWCLEEMHRGPQRQEQGECQGCGTDVPRLLDIAGSRSA